MSSHHDTLAQRWVRLEPHVQVFGPRDREPRPAILLFHGCGGIRPFTYSYVKGAVAAGFRVFVVDSFGPRGWNHVFASAFVCTGAVFRGGERAGDVLAALAGVSARSDVDASRLVLAGFSHGAWAVMDLMTMPLKAEGEAGLADPDDALLSGVQGLFLVYPYGGVGALSRMRPWLRAPKVLGVVARQDHITSERDSERVFAACATGGCETEIWRIDATHAFDEPDPTPFFSTMRHDPELAAEAVERFVAFALSCTDQGTAGVGAGRESFTSPL